MEKTMTKTITSLTLDQSPRLTPTGWRSRLHGEPLLSELLEDPVLHLLMRRDGVSAETIRQLAAEKRAA